MAELDTTAEDGEGEASEDEDEGDEGVTDVRAAVLACAEDSPVQTNEMLGTCWVEVSQE